MNKPNVMLAVPAGNSVHTQFAMCFAELVGYTLTRGSAELPLGIDLRRQMSQGSILPDLRMRLVQFALQDKNATHILFIDSDMMFPPDSLLRMLKHNVDIVGSNYPTKDPRAPMPTAEALEMAPLHTRKNDTGLVEANYVGTGLMLINLDVFRSLEQPWFETLYMADHKAYMTEDVFFCQYAKHKGYKVWCDQDLSREVCHVGERWFRMRDVAGWDGAVDAG